MVGVLEALRASILLDKLPGPQKRRAKISHHHVSRQAFCQPVSPNGHLFGHRSALADASFSGRGGTDACFAFKDFPKFQTFISRCIEC